MLYHFGGLTSVYNSDLLEKIDYIPGNFGVRYGRAIGGIIDIEPRDGARDGYHGYVKLDFIDAAAMVEGPVGKGSFALALRRSTIDAVLAAASHYINLGFTTAPRYWDYQAIFTYPLWGGKFKLLIFGSDDYLSLVMKDAPDEDPGLRGGFDNRNWFHTCNAYYTKRFGPVNRRLDELRSAVFATRVGERHQLRPQCLRVGSAA